MPSFLSIKLCLWILAGMAAVVVAEEIRIHLWRVDYNAVKAERDTALTNLGAARLNIATLSASIAEQNAAVLRLQSEASSAKISADARVAAALTGRTSEASVTGTGPAVMNAWLQKEYGAIR